MFFFGAVKERCEKRKQRNAATVGDRPMHRIPRNEDQVPGLYSPGFLSNSEPALTFENQHHFVMIRLDMDHIATAFKNVHVAGDVLSIKEKRSFDWIRSRCSIGREAMKGVR